jgi:hypothetical protein
VAVQCAERGSLLADIWAGYSAMVDAVNGSLQVGRPPKPIEALFSKQQHIVCRRAADTRRQRRMLRWSGVLRDFACMPQEQYADMRQEREAAAARAEVAEGALRDERLRAALAASKAQEQMHQ